jgi:hypothetical protein
MMHLHGLWITILLRNDCLVFLTDGLLTNREKESGLLKVYHQQAAAMEKPSQLQPM